jgi:hypothetical protein
MSTLKGVKDPLYKRPQSIQGNAAGVALAPG